MTKDEALIAAQKFLHRTYGDGPPTIVMEPEATVEHALAWVVCFDTQEHLDTGDFTKAPMNRVIVVFKDGSELGFAPGALTTDEFNSWLTTGQWPPGAGA
ncbi:YrhB domain-containing protein [Streptomyces sp. RKAG337]|uniref:YrhB domain-containing protein n=1 Tax=Streptomyces sp. RKAG337 TaxID=2893404 RepID=UPI00203392CC|nr:YrhB domain-containing protein [Streptomyces sp. RKAG337]MCM2425797.1 YrhB family protein [Streptomyces sp. RKAG337]